MIDTGNPYPGQGLIAGQKVRRRVLVPLDAHPDVQSFRWATVISEDHVRCTVDVKYSDGTMEQVMREHIQA